MIIAAIALLAVWITALTALAFPKPPAFLLAPDEPSASFMRERHTRNAKLVGVGSIRFEYLRLASSLLLAVSALLLVASKSTSPVILILSISIIVGVNAPTMLISRWARQRRRELLTELSTLLRCLAHALTTSHSDSALREVLNASDGETFAYYRRLAEHTKAWNLQDFWHELHHQATAHNMGEIAAIALENQYAMGEHASLVAHIPELLKEQADRCAGIAARRPRRTLLSAG